MASSAVPLSPHSRAVKSARRLTKRSLRAQHRQFLAEGPQAVREALAATGDTSGQTDGRTDGQPAGLVVEVFGTRECAQRHPELRAAAAAAGVTWQQVSADVLQTIAQTVTPQGVVAVCRFLDHPLDRVVTTSTRLLVVCADVRDPGNAGTVIRTADAAGADAVVLAGNSVDLYNGKVVRASAGSLFHLPLASGCAVPETVSTARGAGMRVLAADGSGSLDLFEAEATGLLDGPVAWLFGNEAWGLPAELTASTDAVVRVPILGRAESLNLATAAAVCLYASARVRG